MDQLLPITTHWGQDQFLQSRETYGKKLLDICCGSGVFLYEAKKLGYDVRGIDFNAESLRVAREKFGLPEVEMSDAGGFFTAHPDRKFDIITFFEALEHQEDVNKFISMVKTGLRPGGTIALSVPNRSRFLDPLGEIDYPPLHLTRWSGRSLKGFLERNGFEVLNLEIKKLTADDLMHFFTQGIIHKMKSKLVTQVAQTESSGDKPPLIYRKYILLRDMKNLLLRIAFSPFIPVLKLIRLQGLYIYCLARLK